MALTAERLRQILKYDPDTGVFTWLERTSNRISVGDEAGMVCPTYGYRVIGIGGRLYRANRVAWLYMTGAWPADRIDHKNRIRSDDRWENLREATHAQNLANAGPWKHNTSGYRGVHFHPQTGRWRARLANKSLGLHRTPEEAHAAYQEAAKRIYGEFALQ